MGSLSMAVSDYLRDAMRTFGEGLSHGIIDAHELKQILTRAGDAALTEEEASEVVEDFADSHRQVDVQEFLLVLTMAEPRASDMQRATRQRNAGKLGEAVRGYRSVLETRRRELGDEHPSTICSLEHLGMALYMQTDLDGAAKCLREVVESRKTRCGPHHPQTLTAIAGLGCLLKDAKDFAGAEELLTQAAAAFEGDFTEKAITSRGMLATLYKDRGDLPRAREMLQSHLDEIRVHLGPSHTSYVTSCVNLGEVMMQLGDLRNAEPLLRDAVRRSGELKEEAGRFMCEQTAKGNLARLLEARGAYDEAISLLTDVVGTFAQIQHPMTVPFRAALARLHKLAAAARPLES